MFRSRHTLRLPLAAAVLAAAAAAGCKSARDWRLQADERAAAYLSAAQRDVTGDEEPILVETPADTLRRRLLLDQGLWVSDPASFGIRDLPTNLYWNADERLEPGAEGGALEYAGGGTNALQIGLLDAVRIAAHNSREYQAEKESLFTAALALDLENHAFRSTFSGLMSGQADTSRADGEDRTGSHGESAKAGVSRTFESGAKVTGALAFNLAGMLTGDKSTAWGALADLSVTVPLLRGSGRLVNMESLTQAERNLVYAVREFEQYKRSFVVDVEGAYLALVLARRTRQNEDDNYRRVILSTRRSRRMADANRMSKAEFAQSYQSELSARAGWIGACQTYEAALEAFKIKLGLPPDARIEPRDEDLADLQRYAARVLEDDPDMDDTEGAGGADAAPAGARDEVVLVPPESVDSGAMKRRTDRAIAIAFSNRLDVLTYRDRLEDAQRHLVIAEDALRAEVTLGGSAAVGESASASMGAEGRDHGRFRVRDATAGARLTIDLPFERTSERNAYRSALLGVEQAVRAYQAQEDGLKRTVRQDMRALALTAERLRIQFRAVRLAERRVRNQDILLEAGRASMTDVLDAQAALLAAQNALYAAITAFRENELRLQCDLGVLDVAVGGAWSEADLAELGVSEPEPAGPSGGDDPAEAPPGGAARGKEE